LGEYEPSIYLRGRVKYWDNLIVFGKREIYGELLEHTIFPKNRSLLRNGGLMEMLLEGGFTPFPSDCWGIIGLSQYFSSTPLK